MSKGNNSSMNELKNRLRGHVASYKSKKFEIKKGTPPQVQLKNNIKLLLLDSRKHLKPHLYEYFITWTQEQVNLALRNSIQNKIGFDDLQGLYQEAPCIDLEQELNWVAQKIIVNQKQINSFINRVELIELNSFSGNYIDAISQVDLLNDDYGMSIWSIKLKIALLQVSKGLEDQKKYTSEVRRFFNGGVLDYIAFNTSIKNEVRTTLSKYIDDVKRQVKRSNLAEDTKTYLKYTLISEFPENDSGLAGILKTEQNFSLIDLYSTFISILQHLYKSKQHSDINRLLKQVISTLSEIKDYRLDKLRLYLGDECLQNFYTRNTSISDHLFSGRHIDALKSFKKTIRNSSIQDPWNVIYSSLAYSSKSKSITYTSFKPHELYKSIGQIFQDDCDVYNQTLSLTKTLTNFSGLPLSNSIVDFLNIVFNNSSTRNWSFKHVGLNSPYYGVEDGDNYTDTSTATFQVWTCRALPNKVTNFISFYKNLFFVMNSIEKKEFLEALNVLRNIPETHFHQPLITFKNNLELHCLFELDRKEEIIELISYSCNSSNNLNALLPIKSALEFFNYESFILSNNFLAGPITLFNLWVRNDSSDTLSYLRIMTKSTLKKLGVTKPSELTSNMVQVNKKSFVFFLDSVCAPQIIDIVRSLKGTKAVLLERQAICQNLIELNPDKKSVYTTEMLDIEHELQISEGQRMVDGTRIYVDMDALIRWSQKEMLDEFNRYRDIVKLNLNNENVFDDSLIEYTSILDGVNTNLNADNEADALLFTMVNKISYEFLTNSSFGLDFYLSKRIRHQSFIGLIRSHYEFSNLITVRENKNKDYEYNHNMVNKFTSLDPNEKNKVNKYLTGFAQKFDETLFEVRDKKFHVKSKDHPDGLIGIEYNPLVIGILKTYLEPCKTLDEFLENINVILWAILTNSLQRTRDYISDVLKIEVTSFVDQLKANVQKIASNDSFYLDFETTLLQKSSDVQRALDEVVCWFTPIEPADLNKTFSLKQILQIAVDGVLRLHKAFKPIIELVPTYNNTIELHSDNLTLINDTLFILFDNVKEHSGIKKPKIKIQVDTDEEEYLSLIFISESKPSLRKRHEEELLKISDIIKRKAFGTRTKKEGKSGIIKLAVTVDEIPKAKLNYGFNTDGYFEVALKYPLLFETTTLGEKHAKK